MTPTAIERVVIALEPAAHNRAAIAAAASLAKQLGVGLTGVFVQDINLIHYSSLPFARTLRQGERSAQPISAADMEHALQAQAQRLQRLVREMALQSQLHAEFSVLRGEVTSSLCTASAAGDLLIVSRRTRSARAQAPLGRTAKALLAAAQASVLLLQPPQAPARPVVVVFDGSDRGERALRLAVALAREDDRQLTVLYPAAEENAVGKMRTKAEFLLASMNITARHRPLAGNSAADLLDSFNQAGGRLLVLGAKSSFLDVEAYDSLLHRLDAPLLLVR